ncbi:MAG: TetR/AcrR family transcriptional regulator [Lachnospiraceae bacterium]|nr:TetR/AcrR family transcriptional regulator [Lachnospiraceae bacterium]
MAAFTKEIIVRTLMDLLNERSLSQITVKDIVERCGINRNTFYYHFHDIRDVMEFALKREMDQIMQTHLESNDVIDGLIQVVERFQENKKAILHIYRSMDRAVFQQQLDALCEYIVNEYVWHAEPYHIDAQLLTKEDERLVKMLEKCTMEGILLEWLEHGMKEDLPAGMQRLMELLVMLEKRESQTENIFRQNSSSV